jgi:hypothetical protein
MQPEGSAHYPMHLRLEGYLAGLVATEFVVGQDGSLNISSDSIDTTLAARDDFKEGVKDARELQAKMDKEIPKREYLYE